MATSGQEAAIRLITEYLQHLVNMQVVRTRPQILDTLDETVRNSLAFMCGFFYESL